MGKTIDVIMTSAMIK